MDDTADLLEEMKTSRELTVRQYLFAAGLSCVYQQMKNSGRDESSDDAGKSMFAHLVSLIQPTCTNIWLDITSPGLVTQLNNKEDLTGKLEMAYTTFCKAYLSKSLPTAHIKALAVYDRSLSFN